jgi:hypothetical protein
MCSLFYFVVEIEVGRDEEAIASCRYVLWNTLWHCLCRGQGCPIACEQGDVM